MNLSDSDRRMMARALQLAANGRGHTSPNPMVGAVVVAPDGRIIGEGWHRHYGGPHAEVNALASVAPQDRQLLKQSTVYVTLEPCAHYGKTPPCAKLLADTHVARVVTGCGDPNPKVAGRGLAMLREAGIKVTEGVMADECKSLNREFMAAHTRQRPWVTLKWAQSADGFIDGSFSTAETRQIVHRRRALADAIIVGAGTVIADRPALTTRHYAGRTPRAIVLDRHNLAANAGVELLNRPGTLHITDGRSVAELLRSLYADYGYISVLVEGGASVLRSFLDEEMWDEAFVEKAPYRINGKVKAPVLQLMPASAETHGANIIFKYLNSNNTNIN